MSEFQKALVLGMLGLLVGLCFGMSMTLHDIKQQCYRSVP